ncbi:putative pectate lyase 14 isoform X2 [Magnolia sinica]|uniref:putative pectate lyase 14 isoform X2 n=1 Tax=Magnolia sinica TaxID=86752 RepID=UPI002659846A|nr:putative pectate lyase 14 isoform X2 [Magnolia sinica]
MKIKYFKKELVFSRCRHGYFHVVNNDYTHWEMYAIGGSANPTINSQGNKYLAPMNRFAKEALVVKLRKGTGPNANTGVVTRVLATVGELARVCHWHSPELNM